MDKIKIIVIGDEGIEKMIATATLINSADNTTACIYICPNEIYELIEPERRYAEPITWPGEIDGHCRLLRRVYSGMRPIS